MLQYYFNSEDINKPYASEDEYIDDLLCHIDMGLTYFCAFRAAEPSQRRAFGSAAMTMPVTSDEIIRELDYFMTNPHSDAEDGEATIRSVLKAAEAQMLHRLARTPQKGTHFPIVRIFEHFHLTKAERFFFVLALAPHRRARYESIFEFLQGAGRLAPTLRLAIALYRLSGEISDEEHARLLSMRGSLFELLVLPGSSDRNAPLSRMFSVTRRILGYLAGEMRAGAEYAPLFSQFLAGDELPPMHIRRGDAEHAAEIFHRYGAAPNTGNGCNMLHIYGENGSGKLLPLKHAAAKTGYGLLVVNVAPLMDGKVAELDLILRDMMLECRLTRSIMCFVEDVYKADDAEAARVPFPMLLEYLIRKISRELDFFVWITEERAAYLLKYDLHVVSMGVQMPSAGERAALWSGFTENCTLDEKIDLTLFANQYNLTAKGIKESLITARMLSLAGGEEQISREKLATAIRQQSVNHLGSIATQINAIFTWDDLVIDEEQRWQMQLICDQVRYRGIVGEQWGFHSKTPYGRGICAMFYGSPGTGKTMAVQVIANELGLDLYRIDISQMVSKYIGETEKNISDLFRRAKNINALLFFDEADSLFAKRSEVRDSHDRNANAETAHLLQKLEDYSGITILATNFINNIDDAFKRRIKFMVNFAFPPPDVRYMLWTTILPKAALIDEELDLRFFADKFELSGSSIKEILTNAAYMAAASMRGMQNRDIVRAVKLNFGKYGKVLTSDDFGYLG